MATVACRELVFEMFEFSSINTLQKKQFDFANKKLDIPLSLVYIVIAKI